eukprot:10435763-Karenia_brevis.AAC.1
MKWADNEYHMYWNSDREWILEPRSPQKREESDSESQNENKEEDSIRIWISPYEGVPYTKWIMRKTKIEQLR